MQAVIANNLSKSYTESAKALDSVSFSLDEGEVFGFLGPNGSGKTTTIKLLMGMLTPTEGSCKVFDLDPSQSPHLVHRVSGALTEHAQMYNHLTAIQNLLFYAALFGLDTNASQKRAELLLERLGLSEAAHKKLSSYSTGMRQRLSLARAMLHEPKLLFLDEPTSGLDPESARSVNELITQLAEDKGTTVFLCTHQLRYAQDVCTSYGLVDKGVLLAKGTIDYLRSITFSGVNVVIETDRMPANITAIRREEGTYELSLPDEDDIPGIVSEIVNQGGSIYRVSAEKLSLEDIYFSLIQQRSEAKGEHDDR